MGLRRKPHTLTLIPVSNSNTEARVDAPQEGTARNIQCQITPFTSEQAYKQFGIETSRPALLLTDVGDGRTLKIGDRAVYGTRSFYVKADPMIWDAGQATDHCQILLGEEQE